MVIYVENILYRDFKLFRNYCYIVMNDQSTESIYVDMGLELIFREEWFL